MRFAAKILIQGPDWLDSFHVIDGPSWSYYGLVQGRDKRVKEEILGLKFDPHYVTCMYLYFPAYGYP